MAREKAQAKSEEKSEAKAPSKRAKSSTAERARLADKYRNEVIGKLKTEFGYKNVLQIPKLEKIVVNMGLGKEVVANSKAIDSATSDLVKITGQKPVIRRAKKSIANFKLRQGIPVGVSVTLRKQRMYEFLDRFLNIALPRVRDFRGVPKNSFDGNGNYSLGFSEQIIFPEIDLEMTELRGLNVTFVTTAKTDKEGQALLAHIGFPFRT